MITCTTCNMKHNNPELFHTKFNGHTVCLKCWQKELEQFAQFCKYWRGKTTSEHGIETLRRITEETTNEIEKTKQKIEQLRIKYRKQNGQKEKR